MFLFILGQHLLTLLPNLLISAILRTNYVLDSASSITPYLDTNLLASLGNTNSPSLKDTGIPPLPNLLTAPSLYRSPFPCDTLRTAASDKSEGESTEVTEMCFSREDEKGPQSVFYLMSS